MYIRIHMHLYIIYVLLSKLTIMFPSAFKIHLGVFYPSSLPLPDKVPTLFSPFSLYRARVLLDPLYILLSMDPVYFPGFCSHSRLHTSKDSELGFTNKRENVVFVFLDLGYLC